ncbi:hypothetical protein F4861DRAFT_513016 [Xylaria intraflava]|nr:hypothetical protein F4861DRAFT_513016 [Xylaria intraflava]
MSDLSALSASMLLLLRPSQRVSPLFVFFFSWSWHKSWAGGLPCTAVKLALLFTSEIFSFSSHTKERFGNVAWVRMGRYVQVVGA